jgi:hypothetical protein
MDSPRVIGLAAATLVVAGWLLGSTLSPPVAQSQARVPVREAAAREPLPAIVPLVSLATRTPAPAPPAPRRNPFAFGRDIAAEATETAAPSDAAPAAAPEPDAGIAAAAAGIGDGWRLLGIAVAADGVITAIVGRRGDVHLVRAGDELPEDVAVSEVTEAGVQLRRADGSAIDLRLP